MLRLFATVLLVVATIVLAPAFAADPP
ncbi:MAG: hypothetical protein RLZ44_152, partial [Pseudomonadota bacterium]